MLQAIVLLVLGFLSILASPVMEETFTAALQAFPTTVQVCRGTSGVSALYAIPYSDFDHATTGVAWDADEQATAFTLVAAKTWFKIPFDADTCFFNQESTQVGRRGLVYNQNITFKMTDDSNDVRKAIKALEQCCDLVFYVKLNNGNTKLAGILPITPATSDSRSLQMLTGAGFVNSGADSSADETERQYSLVARSPHEAPFTTVAESVVLASSV